MLHHRLQGPAEGPALLLIHPLGGDLRFWEPCLEIWGPGRRILRCDLRSAGASPRASAPATPEQHCEDLEALRASLGLEAVVPVGCAVGAMVAALYAARYPQHVPAVVLSNAAASTLPAAREAMAERARLVREGGMAAILPGALERAFAEQPKDAAYRHYSEIFAAQDPEAYAFSCLGILDTDIHAELERIEAPALVVAGRHDLLFPPNRAAEVASRIPRARLVTLEDAAHFLPYQQPRAFATLVEDFLAEVLPPARGPASGCC